MNRDEYRKDVAEVVLWATVIAAKEGAWRPQIRHRNPVRDWRRVCAAGALSEMFHKLAAGSK